MNDLQIFKNAEFGEIRTVIIENEPWFVGKDVAVILGYADPNKAIAMHVDEDGNLWAKRKEGTEGVFDRRLYVPLEKISSQ